LEKVVVFAANAEGAATDMATTIMAATVSIMMMRFICSISFPYHTHPTVYLSRGVR